MIVTLSEAKAHMRVDFNDEDGDIARIIEAAESYLSGIGCTVADPVPPTLKQAALLLIGHWYTRREAVDGQKPGEIPFGVSALINNLRETPL